METYCCIDRFDDCLLDAVFFLMYRMNNKYTAFENKAIQGVLYVDRDHADFRTKDGIFYANAFFVLSE